jgi:hypothetical protein
MLRRLSTSMIVSAVCCLGSVTSAYSDQFQIRDRASRAVVGFAKFEIAGRTFYTDYQGRVVIDLTRGGYTIEITYKGKLQKIPIQIDGARSMKTIDLD